MQKQTIFTYGCTEQEIEHYRYALSIFNVELKSAKDVEELQNEILLIDFQSIKAKDNDERMSILQHWCSMNKVIILSSSASLNNAVELMQCGALDIVVKPVHLSHLQKSYSKLISKNENKKEFHPLKKSDDNNSTRFIGSSAVMAEVYERIRRASHSDASIFIKGESGTGKDVCARAIHEQSVRKNKPFIALNCGAIPKELIESEVFGHIKGSFTGAVADRIGAVEAANGGTLFLDEVCEMDMALQTKLLRFLQTGVFHRVGSSKEQKTDCRIICATNKLPEQEVSEGRFRQDLYYRLHVIPIHMPALRTRERDILELASYYLDLYNKQESKNFIALSPRVTDLFLSYLWPGNVRELQNVIRQAIVLHDDNKIEPHMLPAFMTDDERLSKAFFQSKEALPLHVVSMSAPEHPHGIDAIRPLAVEERLIIERALRLCEGNIPKAAALLDVSPSTLYRKKLGWEEEDAKPTSQDIKNP